MAVIERTTPVTIGRVFADKYRVDGLLGNGGMGVVFAATHLLLETRVAIKLLRADISGTPTAAARLLREARATARIKSENVARILDIGTVDWGGLFIVMEYLEGQDLAALMQEPPGWSPSEAVSLLLQACEGVRAAHALGIIHRDLKPSNLFVTKDPSGTAHVKVLDFGVSKLVDPKTGSPIVTRGGDQLTRPDSKIGSPIYMSPEQLVDPRAVDVRTDIWSLGVILFEMLTGQMPFQAKTLPELCTLILHEKPRSMRDLRPDLPPGLLAIVERCLNRLPAQRYAGVGALMEDLAPFALPVAVPASPPSAPLRRSAGRPVLHRWIVATAGVLGALALAVAITHHRRPTPVSAAAAETRPSDTGTATIPVTAAGVAAQNCSACLAASCAKAHKSCESNRTCGVALAAYDACIQQLGGALLADCAQMLRTDRSAAARRLTNCMFARQGASAAIPGKCAGVCAAGTISRDVPVTSDARHRSASFGAPATGTGPFAAPNRRSRPPD